MPTPSRTHRPVPLIGWLLLVLGIAMIAFGWMVPSRFKSVPFGVVREAGQSGRSLADLAHSQMLDGNYGAARLLADTAADFGEERASLIRSQVAMELEANPQVARWGAWDPFLDAALQGVPLEDYANEPGFLGVLLGEACRQPVAALLENSRDPLVGALLQTGELSTYRRLFPVSSASGRPLEATLLGLGLLAQGGHLGAGYKEELRELVWEARATGNVGALEDAYLDALSLMRLFDWGQLTEVVSRADSVDALARLRYLLHRKAEERPLVFAMALASSDPSSMLDYLERFGDEGFASLEAALKAGVEGYRLALREQLPIEEQSLDAAGAAVTQFQDTLARFSLRNPQLGLSLKYGSFFVGSLLALYGASLFRLFYRESVSPALAVTQRLFGACASVLVFGVMSEPYLARASDFEGYSFRFVMPVLAQVDGELQIVETTPTTTMESATLLSIAFFFLLQALVFLICMLKVREIERRDLDPLVKLKLMENEDNLFDSGLYVGIAGTCIALVMQVINLVEANLIAAYSSNLFGILCVAIVKIRLVRPYKTKLIMAGQDQLKTLEIRG